MGVMYVIRQRIKLFTRFTQFTGFTEL